MLGDAALAVATTVAEMLDDGEFDMELLGVAEPVLDGDADSDFEENTEPDARADDDMEADPVLDEVITALREKTEGEVLGDIVSDSLGNGDALDEPLKLALPLFEREIADEVDAREDTVEHGVALVVADWRTETDDDSDFEEFGDIEAVAQREGWADSVDDGEAELDGDRGDDCDAVTEGASEVEASLLAERADAEGVALETALADTVRDVFALVDA